MSKFGMRLDDEIEDEPPHQPTYLVYPGRPNNSSVAFAGAMSNTLLMASYRDIYKIRKQSPIAEVREYRRKGDKSFIHIQIGEIDRERCK